MEQKTLIKEGSHLVIAAAIVTCNTIHSTLNLPLLFVLGYPLSLYTRELVCVVPMGSCSDGDRGTAHGSICLAILQAL